MMNKTVYRVTGITGFFGNHKDDALAHVGEQVRALMLLFLATCR